MADLNSYIRLFQSPDKSFRPVTMWFWNDRLDKAEITFQLEEFKKQGIYEVFVNAAFGLETEYLSDEWFGYVKYCVAECKRLGMKYWIYDEYNWPSGNAGGKLLSQYPWAVGRLLQCRQFTVWAGHCADALSTGTLVAAQILITGPEKEFEVIDIMDRVTVQVTDTGDTKVQYRNTEYSGAVQVQYFFSMPDPHILTTSVWYKHAGYEAGYIDTFNRAATEKFLELTHERYKQAVGEEFGQTVMGVFTDEICLASPFSIGENRIPWSEHFARQFKERNGYDIIPHLYSLFNGALTKQDRKIRNDYFNTAKALYLENFVRPMYDWCEQNGLLFTGHFDGEESLNWHLMQSADLLTSMQYMHIPGIDAILPRYKIDDKNFNVAGKILNSAVKYYDRDRALCETYTGSGWDMRFDTMKRIANRLLTLGVNMTHYMGAYYSWDGMAKIGPTTYPPSHGYNNTLWPYYGRLGDYFARVQALSAATKGGSKALFMTPLVQAKQDLDLSKNIFDYLEDSFSTRYLDEIMESTVTASMQLGVDLDLVSEDAAPEITAADGVMTYRGYAYKYIIFPAMRYIDKNTAALVARLADAGVRMLFVNTLPEQVVDAAQPALDRDYGQTVPVFESEGAALAALAQPGCSLLTVKQRPLAYGDFLAALEQAFDAADRALGMQTTGNVYIGHRENADLDLYFICNDDDAENQVYIPGPPQGMQILSPDTGMPKAVAPCETGVQLTLAPYELAVILCGRQETVTLKTEALTPAPSAEVRQLTRFTFTPQTPNALRAVWQYRHGDKYYPVDFFSFPSYAAVTRCMDYTLKWEFTIAAMPPQLFFNAEIKDVRQITINGRDLPFAQNTRLWGMNDFKADATDWFAPGKNTVLLQCRTPDWAGIHALPFTYISGDFLVTESLGLTAAGDRRVSLGSLDGQGYRYFSGAGSYKTVFTAKAGQKALLQLDTREIVRVVVNGCPVRDILWQPRTADISAYIRDGENQLELVMTTTYANLLAPKPADNGIAGVSILTY